MFLFLLNKLINLTSAFHEDEFPEGAHAIIRVLI